MPIIELTEARAEEVVDSSELALITFSAPACPACRAFAPTFEAAAGVHPEATFCRVDTKAEPGLARAFEVESVPTTVVLREQILLLVQPGAISGDSLEEILRKAQSLDMDDLRRRIAKESGTDEPEPES